MTGLQRKTPLSSSQIKRKTTRKCVVCLQEFVPWRPGVKTCGEFDCQHAYALSVAEKSAAKRAKEAAKAERASIKARKEKIKTRSDWMKEAQVAWNFYVRMRDLGRPCASCGAMPEQKYGGTMDCSHYRSVGAAPHLRFHLHNAAAACVRCNRHLSGNVAALRVGLIERIGLAKVEAVDADNDQRKFSVEYLKRVKKIFTKKARKINERREA